MRAMLGFRNRSSMSSGSLISGPLTSTGAAHRHSTPDEASLTKENRSPRERGHQKPSRSPDGFSAGQIGNVGRGGQVDGVVGVLRLGVQVAQVVVGGEDTGGPSVAHGDAEV